LNLPPNIANIANIVATIFLSSNFQYFAILINILQSIYSYYSVYTYTQSE